jgi:SAV2148-like HEPN
MTDQTEGPFFGISELSPDVLAAYAHLWQFETWLRRLVYVQLRALDGDAWDSKIRAGKAVGPKTNDKRMTHMPTPEDDVLSFIQLSELQRVVADHWHLFEAYLPPRTIWEAKLEEVVAIRHRVAHFRTLHRDDLARVRQFLRDIDQGFWRFCTSYNDAHPVLPQTNDPVVAHFLPYDLFAWTEVEDKKWARIGHADPAERFTMTVEILRMPWATWRVPIAHQPGFLYDVNIVVRGQWHYDYRRLLKWTKAQHKHAVHTCVDSGAKTFRVTLPAVLGEAKLIEIIEAFHEGAQNGLVPGLDDRPAVVIEAMAAALPESVLGPQNPLTFLSPDMPCAFFQGLDER